MSVEFEYVLMDLIRRWVIVLPLLLRHQSLRKCSKGLV
jgi:hypothetical protein